MNPTVLNAAGLLLIGSGAVSFPGVPGHEPDLAKARQGHRKMVAAYDLIRRATPGAGSYVNESSFFDTDWGEQYWGIHYPRLCEIKREVDPMGLFWGHHLIGSEWL